MADSGTEITIPVRADAESDPAPPPAAREFLIREFANTRIFDDQGLIVSDTTYDKWFPYAGAMFRSHIDANFKKAGCGFSI